MSGKIEHHIEQSEKLTSLFGHWPSFHDAEVIELHLDRGEIDTKDQIFDFPVLRAKIQLTERLPGNNLPSSNDLSALVVLEFENVTEFSLREFNYQNAIYDLNISISKLPPNLDFQVKIDGAFGMSAVFCSSPIRVLDAVPWPVGKRIPKWSTDKKLFNLPK